MVPFISFVFAVKVCPHCYGKTLIDIVTVTLLQIGIFGNIYIGITPNMVKISFLVAEISPISLA